MLASYRRLAGAAAGIAVLMLPMLLIGFASRPTEAVAPTPAPSAGRAQPSAGPLTKAERAWLAAVAKIQDRTAAAFSGETVELTRATMQAMANSLGECRRGLRRIGPPTVRLKPVFVLVDQACAQSDKGAECFSTAIKASDASGTTKAGSPEERIVDQAITCGFAGYNDGTVTFEAATAEGARIDEEAAITAAATPTSTPAAAYPDPAVCLDEVGILGADTCARISQVLQADERASTDEIAVVIVPSTGGLPIETWGTGLFNAWGVGKRDTNNGVLLVVATDDRRLRIVAGRGLTDRLPDGAASEIIGGTITPLFKDGRMQDGVLAGLDEIRRKLGHHVTNRLTDPNMAPIPVAADSQGDPAWVGWLVVPGALGIFGLVGFLILRGVGKGQGSGGDSGSSGSGSSFSSGSSGSSGGSSFGGGSSAGGGASGSW